MNGSPAFRLYAQDFENDQAVRLMDLSEVGLYILLLCRAWTDGDIPDDGKAIARLVGRPESKKLWPAVRRCFDAVPGREGRLQNRRLEEERQKQSDFRRKLSESGSQGAAKRWGRYGDPISEANGEPNGERNGNPTSESMAPPLATPMAEGCLPSSSSSSDNVDSNKQTILETLLGLGVEASIARRLVDDDFAECERQLAALKYQKPKNIPAFIVSAIREHYELPPEARADRKRHQSEMHKIGVMAKIMSLPPEQRARLEAETSRRYPNADETRQDALFLTFAAIEKELRRS
jgi:uncharacterized protein YdaU (DUF1376 family)